MSLASCAPIISNVHPDVVVYSYKIQDKAADEMESGYCTTLSEVMMPDYKVMRDQARVQ